MNQFSSEKILRHLERIVEWQKTGLSRPITYELDMTNICNSKCSFCFGFHSCGPDTSSLAWEEVKDIIGQIQRFGGRGLTFTGGGEPLCNPRALDAVRYAKTLGLDVGFITNGILLDEQKAITLVDCCTWIRVSLDAGSKEVYLRMHGLDGDLFERVAGNTALLVKAKKARGSGVTIGTGFLTFPEVIGDMLAYTALSRDIGVDYAQFRPLLKKFLQKEINLSADYRVLDTIRECQKLSTPEFQVLSSVHKYESMRRGELRRDYGRCHGHNFAAVISANRKMYLCCHMRGMEKYCIGDLKEQGLERIWGSEQRKHVHENIDFQDYPLLCRCDSFNSLLWNISKQGEHENFL
ncbi:MAG: radical SAM protein [Endomicrobiales bacterium]